MLQISETKLIGH